MFKRHFLARRRFDGPALLLAFALLGVVDNLAKLLVALFAFAGIYLVLARHRSIVRAPRLFSIALFAYGAATVAFSLMRGEPLAGNRQLGYGLIAAGLAFLPMGLVLVRHPLTAAVSGARVGVLAAAALAVLEYLVWGSRVGIGENPAIFAFVVAALGLVARIDVPFAPRFLPNSRLWLYVSFLPVLLSLTRAVWAVYALALLLDAIALVQRRKLLAGSWLPLAGAIGLAVLLAIPGIQILNSGVQRGLSDYSLYSDDVRTETSIGIRLAMWRGALSVAADHPLFGVGAMQRVDAVADRMPASADVLREFTHLHNLVVDEMLSNGVVGLSLMLAVFAAFLIGVWRGTRERTVRETAFLLVFLTFAFGAFHGVMLHETTLMTIYASFGVILVEIARRRTARAVSDRTPSGKRIPDPRGDPQEWGNPATDSARPEAAPR